MTRSDKRPKRNAPTPERIAEQRHFTLRAPGRPARTLTASNPETLARYLAHNDVGPALARKLAGQLWDAPIGTTSDEHRGTYLERVAVATPRVTLGDVFK